MIPAPFDLVTADSAEAAVAALVEHGDDAKLLAGGHSLLPLMKLRLAAPAVLVDIGRLRDRSFVRDDGAHVTVGALTRHRDLETSPVLAEHAPLLAAVAAQIGDPAVRHRGTIGGSLAHGDPASDLPAAVLALGAVLVAVGPGGSREIPAEDFFHGFMDTALHADEMLTEIRIPKTAGAGWSFQKFNRRAQDWAIVGAAIQLGPTPRVALINMDMQPLRASATESAVAGGASPAEAAAVAAEGCSPPEDLNADAAYRRHLAQVMVRRGLVEAAGRSAASGQSTVT